MPAGWGVRCWGSRLGRCWGGSQLEGPSRGVKQSDRASASDRGQWECAGRAGTGTEV